MTDANAIPEGHYPRPPDFSSCSPIALCEHAYVVADNLPIGANPQADAEHDRESRDQHRIACLLRQLFVVTVPDNSVWVQDEAGAWNLYERGDTATIEYLLKRAYLLIGDQAKAGVGHLMSKPEDADQFVGHTEAELRFRFHALGILSNLNQSISGLHLRNLSSRLEALADKDWFGHIQRIPAQDMDDYQKAPLLPLTAGGCLNLETGTTLVVDAYARQYRSGREVAAVRYRPEMLHEDDGDDAGLRLAKRLLAEHYPQELLTFVAYVFAYPARDGIGMVKGPPGTGKTTLFRWLAAATGSAAVIDNTEPVSSGQFTPIEDLLASCHIVAIDETDEDKGKGIARGVMNRLTAQTLTLNAKYGAMRKNVRRLGVPVLIGNDWPALDSTTRGLDRRIAFAWDKPMPQLAAGVYEVLVGSNSAREYLLAFIAQRAFELRAFGIEAALKAIRPHQVRDGEAPLHGFAPAGAVAASRVLHHPVRPGLRADDAHEKNSGRLRRAGQQSGGEPPSQNARRIEGLGDGYPPAARRSACGMASGRRTTTTRTSASSPRRRCSARLTSTWARSAATHSPTMGVVPWRTRTSNS